MSAAKLHTSLDTLPLNLFLDCYCDQKFEVLIIEGEANQAELLECWSNLYLDYLDLNEEFEAAYIIDLQTEVALLKNKVSEVQGAVQFLSSTFDIRLVDIIRSHDIFMKVPEDPDPVSEDYQQTLKVVIAQLAPHKQRLNDATKELESHQDENESPDIDRKYFQKTLLRLSRYQHVETIRAKDIMTS